MSWFCYAKFPLDVDLKGIDSSLSQRGIQHRFTEEGNEQYLWLYDESSTSEVHSIIQAFSQGVVLPENTANDGVGGPRVDTPLADQLFLLIVSSPLTSIFILLGVTGYFTQVFAPVEFLREFVYLWNPQRAEIPMEFWKLLTPTFIHFGPAHIIFNGVWIWFFGSKIENVLKKWEYVGYFLCLAVGANLIQFSFSPSTPFGGLSGVVYGYIGFCLIAKRYVQSIAEAVPNGFYIFMIVWLVLGFTGAVDLFMSGGLANWNHLGGLVAGLIWGQAYFVFRSDTKIDE